MGMGIMRVEIVAQENTHYRIHIQDIAIGRMEGFIAKQALVIIGQSA